MEIEKEGERERGGFKRESERKQKKPRKKNELTFRFLDDFVPLAPLVLDPGQDAESQEEEPAAPEPE